MPKASLKWGFTTTNALANLPFKKGLRFGFEVDTIFIFIKSGLLQPAPGSSSWATLLVFEVRVPGNFYLVLCLITLNKNYLGVYQKLFLVDLSVTSKNNKFYPTYSI